MIVYLDTNILTRLKEPSNEKMERLSKILLDSNKFILVYSDVHIQDLKKNKSNEMNEYIEKDLENITEITEERFLYNSPLDLPILSFQTAQDSFKKVEPFSLYSDLTNETIETLLKLSTQNNPVDISWFSDSKEEDRKFYLKYFPKTIEKKNQYTFIIECNKFLEELSEDPNVYNELRDYALEKYDISNNEINNTNDLKQFINKKLFNIESFDFDSMIEKSLNIDFGIKLNKSLIEFMMNFIFIDMFGFYSDRFKKNNKYKNFYLDINHGYLGQHADFFITNDKHTLEKCKIIYKKYQNMSQAFNPEEFIEFYENFLYKSIDENIMYLNKLLVLLDENNMSSLCINEFRLFTFFNSVMYTKGGLVLSYYHESKINSTSKEYQNMISYFDEIFEKRIESNFEELHIENHHDLRVVWVYGKNIYTLQYMCIFEVKIELISLVITNIE